MKIYICEICGEAYIGKEKPSDCPFCGASTNFEKPETEAKVVINEKIALSDISRKNLEYSLDLETKATAIYECMSGKAGSYGIKTMFKRLSKVEAEHANVFSKLLGIVCPQPDKELCSDSDIENFKATLGLEETATEKYLQFAKEASEKEIKLVFMAIAQAERGHVELMKEYLK